MGLADNAELILTIFGFYIALGVMLGLIGGSYLASESFSTGEDPDELSAFEIVVDGIALFFGGITFSIISLPVWASTIIFLPLGLTLLYIVIIVLIAALEAVIPF